LRSRDGLRLFYVHCTTRTNDRAYTRLRRTSRDSTGRMLLLAAIDGSASLVPRDSSGETGVSCAMRIVPWR